MRLFSVRIAGFKRRLYLLRMPLAADYTLAQAVEAIASLGLEARHEARALAMRKAFEARTGAFGPEVPYFEARSRAFWDDAVTRQGFADLVLPELVAPARPWARVLGRAHRGLFYASQTVGLWLLRDIWSGAEFLVSDVDDAIRSSWSAPAGPFDGRVAALASPDGPVRVGILPGALFHPEDAAEAIDDVLDVAREQALETGDVLDALLRMEDALRTMSRVKPAYAYRAQALGRATPRTDPHVDDR
jgi:hypothetical protein